MSDRKLKDELRKRRLLSILPSNASREVLAEALQNAVDAEPCCRENECPCASNGIECHVEVCSCWHASHDSHVHTNKEQEVVDAQSIQTRCGNRVCEMYVVRHEEIVLHTRNVLKICQPCENGTEVNYFI
mmetsp:Transcript_51001/g.59593  ORF Transcript_51001/g.59593 Transcript_51001/m.59593 type:complete len:130 (-) Transcript_51001:384-773(-)